MTRALLSIAEVIEQPEFPAVDVALRKGRHIDRDDSEWFALLHDGQEHVEAWYRRYGCELIYKTDGYFYLLPTSDKFPKRQLGAAEMLVGQTLALLYLDPRTVEGGGVITRDGIVEQMVTVLGADTLIRAFFPNRKRVDERVAQKEVRSKIADATRRLAGLGFATQLPDDKWQIRSSIMRFAEPVRGVDDPIEALARLVAQGDVSLEDLGDAVDETVDDADNDSDGDNASASIAPSDDNPTNAKPTVIRRRASDRVAPSNDEASVLATAPVLAPVAAPISAPAAASTPATAPTLAAPLENPPPVAETAPSPAPVILARLDVDDDEYTYPSDDVDDDRDDAANDDDHAVGDNQDDE